MTTQIPPPPSSRYLQFSPDGRWGWTGEDWEPVRAAPPAPVPPAPIGTTPTGYPLVRPAEPATVAYTVPGRVSFQELSEQLGVSLEELRRLNADHGGWSRHEVTRQLAHVTTLTPGTIIHLPPGTRILDEHEEELSGPADRFAARPPTP